MSAMMQKSLPQITAETQAVMDAVENGGEITPAIEAWMATLEHDAAVKIDGCVYAILKLKAMAAARRVQSEIYQCEADEWASAAKSIETGVERIQDAIMKYLETTGQKRLETPTGRIVRIQANSAPPTIYDEVLPDPRTLPSDITTCMIDRSVVRDRLLKGETYSWARLGQKGTHLRIDVKRDGK